MTAVKWLQSVVECFGNKHELQMSWDTLNQLFEQAKQMEHQQIIHAYGQGVADEAGEVVDATKNAEDYYNEKYNESKGAA